MGTRVPQSISDYPKFGIDLGIVCKACGRTAVFDAGKVSMVFWQRGIRETLPIDTSLFRCRCGSRDVTAIGVPVDWRPDPLPVRPARLTPLYVKPSQWRK